MKHCIRSLIVIAFATILVGCGGGSDSSGVAVTTTSPAPVVSEESVVSVALTAGPVNSGIVGQSTNETWGYNGTIPGPQIEANVGDTVRVTLTNNLPIATTLHWHGVELPANQDGSTISQRPVEPGGTYTYEFKVLRAGLFWYHPHIRTAEAVERGLYGTLLVRDSAEDVALGLPTTEQVLVLDDILLDNNNQLVPFPPADPLEKAVYNHNGRQGNRLLVNGQTLPIFDVESGVALRWRLLNAANSRFFRLAVENRNLYQIGGDQGLLQRPVTQIEPPEPVVGRSDVLYHVVPDTNGVIDLIGRDYTLPGLIMTPGERADVVFTPIGNVGDIIYINTYDLQRGDVIVQNNGGVPQLLADPSEGLDPPQKLFGLRITGGDSAASEYRPPSSLKSIPKIQVDQETTPTLKLVFGHSLPDANGDMVFFARMKDGQGFPFAAQTGADGLEAVVGGTYIIEVTNLTAGMHNFHLHGFRMQLLSTEYVDTNIPAHNLTYEVPEVSWQDTIRIPGRPGAGMGASRSISRIAVTFEDEGREGQVEAFGKEPGETTSGGWLMHCHINEHSALGMATFLNLREQ